MKTLFLQYPACSTCQKAKKWLTENNIEYTSNLRGDAHGRFILAWDKHGFNQVPIGKGEAEFRRAVTTLLFMGERGRLQGKVVVQEYSELF